MEPSGSVVGTPTTPNASGPNELTEEEDIFLDGLVENENVELDEVVDVEHLVQGETDEVSIRFDYGDTLASQRMTGLNAVEVPRTEEIEQGEDLEHGPDKLRGRQLLSFFADYG
ncbi:hypothetical protein CYMTET_29257, partial [Cymbomonas tetramitiformis]